MLAAALLTILGAAGCRGDAPPEEGALAAVTTMTAVSSTTLPAPIETTTPSTVLAGVVGDLPGIRLELNALERESDEVVRLAFTLINTGTTPFRFGDNFGTAGTVDGIYIVDTANDERLGTLTDDAGACRCSRGLQVLEPGQRVSLSAELGAPPADIGLVSVVVPHFPGVQKIEMT
ncbi:MAG: hypothetical protein M3179_13970 [Actinomycetota bacterium]|nr:hypothetical protein [Actinomycetota bacterium]